MHSYSQPNYHKSGDNIGAIRLLLVKCNYNKMVMLPGLSFIGLTPANQQKNPGTIKLIKIKQARLLLNGGIL